MTISTSHLKRLSLCLTYDVANLGNASKVRDKLSAFPSLFKNYSFIKVYQIKIFILNFSKTGETKSHCRRK